MIGVTLAGISSIPPRARASGRDASLRIAAVEGAGAETLIEIGVDPLAVSNYLNDYNPGFEAAAGVTLPVELGSMFQPNLELLQSLNPDLIVCADWQAQFVPLFQRIAPTRMFSLSRPTTSRLANGMALVRELGDLTERADEAADYLRKSEVELNRLSGLCKPASMGPILIGMLQPDGLHVVIYARGSLFSDVLERLGLQNAWTAEATSRTQVVCGIEVLARYPETFFVDLGLQPFAATARRRLEGSTLWNALPSVQAGRILSLSYEWPFGGLPTAMRFAQALSAKLAEVKGG